MRRFSCWFLTGDLRAAPLRFARAGESDGTAEMQLHPTGQQISLLSLDRGTVRQRVRVRFEVTENWTQIAVLEGVAMFETPTAQLNFREGQMARVNAGRVARFQLLRQSDGWSQKRDQLQEQSASAKHLPGTGYGGPHLDLAGS